LFELDHGVSNGLRVRQPSRITPKGGVCIRVLESVARLARCDLESERVAELRVDDLHNQALVVCLPEQGNL
jgi:hypothetical protein